MTVEWWLFRQSNKVTLCLFFWPGSHKVQKVLDLVSQVTSAGCCYTGCNDCHVMHEGNFNQHGRQNKCFKKYISADHGFVEAYHFFVLQLDVSFGSILNLILWQRCAYNPVRFGHKNHVVRVRKTCVWFKTPVLITTNTAGDVMTSCQRNLAIKHGGTLSQGLLDCIQ